jgi:hypothetical protein
MLRRRNDTGASALSQGVTAMMACFGLGGLTNEWLITIPSYRSMKKGKLRARCRRQRRAHDLEAFFTDII